MVGTPIAAQFQVEDTFHITGDAVECVLLSASEGRENMALCFRYRDDGELAQWQNLALAEKTLELVDAGVRPIDSRRIPNDRRD